MWKMAGGGGQVYTGRKDTQVSRIISKNISGMLHQTAVPPRCACKTLNMMRTFGVAE
jgi:hypothetical protein